MWLEKTRFSRKEGTEKKQGKGASRLVVGDGERAKERRVSEMIQIETRHKSFVLWALGFWLLHTKAYFVRIVMVVFMALTFV